MGTSIDKISGGSGGLEVRAKGKTDTRGKYTTRSGTGQGRENLRGGLIGLYSEWIKRLY